MATQEQFKKFISDIEPSQTTKTNGQKAHKRVRDYLQGHDEFKKVHLDSYLSGSYKRDTAVRPRTKDGATERPDVDIIVLMAYGRGDDPEKVLGFLHKVLKQKYGSNARKQNRSVGLSTTLADMDVVPIIAPYGEAGTLYIPDRKLQQWRETNPPRHTTWTTETNTASDGRFKPLVKEFKWWRRQNPTVGRKPKGFVMECIVAECMNYYEKNHAELFVSTLETIVSKYASWISIGTAPFISDPGVPGNSVTYGMTFAAFEGFYNKAKKHAELGRQAINEEDPEKELKMWREIFGERFPSSAAALKSAGLLGSSLSSGGTLSFPDRPVNPREPGGFA